MYIRGTHITTMSIENFNFFFWQRNRSRVDASYKNIIYYFRATKILTRLYCTYILTVTRRRPTPASLPRLRTLRDVRTYRTCAQNTRQKPGNWLPVLLPIPAGTVRPGRSSTGPGREYQNTITYVFYYSNFSVCFREFFTHTYVSRVYFFTRFGRPRFDGRYRGRIEFRVKNDRIAFLTRPFRTKNTYTDDGRARTRIVVFVKNYYFSLCVYFSRFNGNFLTPNVSYRC